MRAHRARPHSGNAFIAVGSGQIDYALVAGVEKLTRLGGGMLPLDREGIETANGMVMPALCAMRAKRYLHDYDYSVRDLAESNVVSCGSREING